MNKFSRHQVRETERENLPTAFSPCLYLSCILKIWPSSFCLLELLQKAARLLQYTTTKMSNLGRKLLETRLHKHYTNEKGHQAASRFNHEYEYSTVDARRRRPCSTQIQAQEVLVDY